MTPHKIVARFRDGRRLRGQTYNFSPTEMQFHLQLVGAEGQNEGRPQVVDLSELKAVFFVRSFLGNPNRKDREYFAAADSYQGSGVEVRFKDGETMVGSTPAYSPSLPGFFVFPADPDSNTIKVFAVNGSVQSVQMLAPRLNAERRTGTDRRQTQEPIEGADRRSGVDRRSQPRSGGGTHRAALEGASAIATMLHWLRQQWRKLSQE